RVLNEGEVLGTASEARDVGGVTLRQGAHVEPLDARKLFGGERHLWHDRHGLWRQERNSGATIAGDRRQPRHYALERARRVGSVHRNQSGIEAPHEGSNEIEARRKQEERPIAG